jgi:hypothetical protein
MLDGAPIDQKGFLDYSAFTRILKCLTTQKMKKKYFLNK